MNEFCSEYWNYSICSKVLISWPEVFVSSVSGRIRAQVLLNTMGLLLSRDGNLAPWWDSNRVPSLCDLIGQVFAHAHGDMSPSIPRSFLLKSESFVNWASQVRHTSTWTKRDGARQEGMGRTAWDQDPKEQAEQGCTGAARRLMLQVWPSP